MKSSSDNGYSTTGSFILVANGQLELKREIMSWLPDECFKPGKMDWEDFWGKVVSAYDAGMTNAEQLAKIYQKSYNSIQESLK